MSIDLSAYEVQYRLAGETAWATIPANRIIDIRPDGTSSSGDHPLTFGDSSDSKCEVELLGAVADLVKDTQLRVRFTRATATAWAFWGLVKDCKRDLGALTVSCVGFLDKVQRSKAYSPAIYRRPVATKTTASSIENPDAAGYQGGLINRLLWQAGGRPAEQDFLYPAATFYYRCDQALLAPEWAWVNGDDSRAAILDLAAASGGQVYQGLDGVLRYRQPLLFAAGVQSFTFTRDHYGADDSDVSYETPSSQAGDKYLCSHTPRSARAMQEVYNDQPNREVLPGKEEIFELEPKFPLKSLECASAAGNTLKAEALNIAFYDGSAVPQADPGGYVHWVEVYAQKVRLHIVNVSTRPFEVYRIILRGEPIIAMEAKQVSAGGSGDERQLATNVNIQTEAQAYQLCMLYVLYGSARRIVKLGGCVYDPARQLGERVGLTVPEWGYADVPHIIVGISISEAGGLAEYSLADARDLPTVNDFFIIGNQRYTGQTKRVGV